MLSAGVFRLDSTIQTSGKAAARAATSMAVASSAWLPESLRRASAAVSTAAAHSSSLRFMKAKIAATTTISDSISMTAMAEPSPPWARSMPTRRM